MMMHYHFGHGVGHTYLRYDDSIEASNTGESLDDDDDGSFQSAQPELAGSEISDELEENEDELGEDDHEIDGFRDDLYLSDDEELLAINEMYN